MKFLLDSSTLIDIFAGDKQALLNFDLASVDDIAVSSIVFAEIAAGMQKEPNTAAPYLLAKSFMDFARVETFGKNAALRAGELIDHLARKGSSIGAMDTLIAAHALELGATLVTANTKHFQRVPGLSIVNWSKEQKPTKN
jgi:tRNA(fMet)-specific endonuclease VapC